jgi:hypothetical protein
LIEPLEDRTTPSILWVPQNGLEHATYGGGSVLGRTSGDVMIYTIYWGSYWGTNAGNAYANQIQTSINASLAFSPYLDGLSQYGIGSRGFAPVAMPTGYTAEVWNPSDPSNGFSLSDLRNVVRYGIHGLGLPESDDFSGDCIYVVFTPPGTSTMGRSGFHTTDSESDSPSGTDSMVEAWVNTTGGIDATTVALSRDVVGAITDPNGDGWQVDPRSPTAVNELTDNEAANYTYRLGGYQVQSYWSQANSHYMVADGNSQNILVDNGTRTLSGDQLGANHNDTISIDTNGAGGVSVTMNGESASFDPGQITAIDVYPYGGSNTVNVYNTKVPVNIQGLGSDTVNVGNSTHGVQGITADVTVTNPPSYTTLNINDGADPVGRTATVTSSSVSGLAPATIHYHQLDLNALNVTGGSGRNTFTVTSTPSNGLGVSTYLNSGGGYTSSVVNLEGTNGPLTVDGGNTSQAVYVGSHGASLGGTLAAIRGPVFVENSGTLSFTSLYVDDGGDTTGQTWNLNSGGLTSTGMPGTIRWTNAGPASSGVDYLQTRGGSGPNTINVNATGSGTFYLTDVYTGTGGATVNVRGTLGPLDVVNQGGQDYVNVGSDGIAPDSTLANINGWVYAYGDGSTYLYLGDSGDATGRAADLSNGTVTGLSPAPIYWYPSSGTAGGVRYLAVYGSGAGSTYTVHDTSGFSWYTYLQTGAGSDTVNVLATTSGLYVNNTGGQDSTYVGSTSASFGTGTTANIHGFVDAYGTGATQLYVDDASEAAGHTVTLNDGSLTGLAPAAISWTPTSGSTGGVMSLEVLGSGGASTYNVSTTSAFSYWGWLQTGGGNDAVNVQATQAPLYVYNRGGSDTVTVGSRVPAPGGTLAGVGAFVYVYGAAGSLTALTVDDSGDGTGRAATLTSGQLTGLGNAGAIYYGSSVTSLTIDAGTGNDTLTVASISATTPVTFNGGGGSNALVGPNATNTWTVGGLDAGNLNGTFTFSTVANLVGGTGVDVFRFTTAASQVTSIDGGGAPAGQGDWLDYSGYTAAVTVNLATGIATGVTGSVRNIQDVHGSNFGNKLTGNAQGNILIGGSGTNTITGGSGRSLLIADMGPSTITGGSGGSAGGGDILIGGSTTYDAMTAANEQALMSILAEWQSADAYLTRFAEINTGGGGGRNGNNKLNWGTTVLDNGKANTLTAQAGTAAVDWFFANEAAGHTRVLNRRTGEHTNNT